MIRFGRCLVDVGGRRLLVDGCPVHLEPQAFDVLVYLAGPGNRVVPREELLDAVWGSRFVSGSALSTRVKEIRRATGDDGAEQGVVRTVRGRGYCLVPSVSAEPDRPLAGPSRGPGGAVLVGRDRDLAPLGGLTGAADAVLDALAAAADRLPWPWRSWRPALRCWMPMACTSCSARARSW